MKQKRWNSNYGTYRRRALGPTKRFIPRVESSRYPSRQPVRMFIVRGPSLGSVWWHVFRPEIRAVKRQSWHSIVQLSDLYSVRRMVYNMLLHAMLMTIRPRGRNTCMQIPSVYARAYSTQQKLPFVCLVSNSCCYRCFKTPRIRLCHSTPQSSSCVSELERRSRWKLLSLRRMDWPRTVLCVWFTEDIEGFVVGGIYVYLYRMISRSYLLRPYMMDEKGIFWDGRFRWLVLKERGRVEGWRGFI